ncbi:MAG: hypothetical protein CME67_01005 [Halobacteriovoraceae bacterium]|nr:hypothetical protein [Halobacteriovoraceae bacterium]
MHDFSDYQRRKLLQNQHIKNVSEKQVVFHPQFKAKSVEDYLAGLNPKEIFEKANINLKWFSRDYPKSCLKKWKKKYLEEGRDSLFEERRGTGTGGGRPKNEKLSELTYEELLAVIEVQKGVIEDLKKKKALTKKNS